MGARSPKCNLTCTTLLLEVHSITKHYGPQKALDGVTLSVPKGQVVGLLGPNGAGKSTLMKSILGYLPADDGTIHFDGIDVRVDERELRLAQSVRERDRVHGRGAQRPAFLDSSGL